jgi:hypothetical protein
MSPGVERRAGGVGPEPDRFAYGRAVGADLEPSDAWLAPGIRITLAAEGGFP